MSVSVEQVAILVALLCEAFAIYGILHSRREEGASALPEEPVSPESQAPGDTRRGGRLEHGPIPRRRQAAIALVTAVILVGALSLTPLSRRILPGPLRHGLYNMGLTRTSPDVEDVQADVERLREALRRSDREQVKMSLRSVTASFDRLDPEERSAIGGDVELQLLRARQFLEGTQPAPDSPQSR